MLEQKKSNKINGLGLGLFQSLYRDFCTMERRNGEGGDVTCCFY
jgi:hypothetical protein